MRTDVTTDSIVTRYEYVAGLLTQKVVNPQSPSPASWSYSYDFGGESRPKPSIRIGS